MKIAHITFSLLNAGKENMLVDIAIEQQKLGHDVAIIILNNSIDKNVFSRIPKCIKIFKMNRNPNSLLGVLSFIKLFFIINLLFRSDIIHSHSSYLGKILRTLLIKRKIFLTIHSPDFAIKPMKYYDSLFAISNSMKTIIESKSKYKCKVIYNGIYVNSVNVSNRIEKKNIYKIIMVKRLDHILKGQDLLIEAANLLINDYKIRNLKFYLVGEGKSREYLKSLIVKYALTEFIFLIGNKSRDWVYENLSEYDIFVHPSRTEGFGLTVIEAMAAKLPVIASNIEGPKEILQNGKYGFMFESENINDLAKQIRNVVNLFNENKIQEVVEKNYIYCSKNFDVRITAKNYCRSYLE